MKVFEATDYQSFISHCLRSGAEKAPKGAVKKLSSFVKCHPSYIAQIVRGKSHFSNEQALRFCDYFKLEQDETEFFIDMLNRDRAATQEMRAHFQNRLDRQTQERLNIKRRWKDRDYLNPKREQEYFGNWLFQAVHALTQIPSHRSEENIAKTLKITKEQTVNILEHLKRYGLVKQSDSRWKSIKDTLHLGKDSPTIKNFHTNWRVKTASDIMLDPSLRGLHFSSLVTLSRETAMKIERLILDCLEEARKQTLKSKSECLYALIADFYPLVD